MIGRYPTVFLSGLTLFAFWLYNAQEDIDMCDNQEKMKVVSVECAFCAEGHFSGDCVKQSAAIIPCSLISSGPVQCQVRLLHGNL